MAMTERRALSVGREDRAAEADRKVREVGDRISALAGVIAAQEARVAQLAAELADAKQGEAREAEAHAVALERALGNLKPAMAEFVNACGADGAVVRERMSMGRARVRILREREGVIA